MNVKNQLDIAFCWYQREEWEKLKTSATDPEILDDTYEEWISKANSAISQIRVNGNVVVKISINIDEWVSWCKENNYEFNASARSEFAVDKLRSRIRKT